MTNEDKNGTKVKDVVTHEKGKPFHIETSRSDTVLVTIAAVGMCHTDKESKKGDTIKPIIRLQKLAWNEVP